MKTLDVFKALSNETRLKILNGLREPEKNFPPQDEGDFHLDGVCVSSIQEAVGLSQSTVSGYLATLERAGLVRSKRMGPWTYYKRNEENIRRVLKALEEDL
ncbi:ArsR/SmtB family transcription factor [Roseivivax sediminis]|uniref:Transcriptional regulator, ArsR family n=1 Tax=Roseivivax sediminis TaxID=936889 RepID=A0A1I1SW51_9RHOB|nr:metalloregulator ArsR/SmtB family transcription factor [Roseivivax sediminis]SFD50571.1 transcriptional regulator, ArsR family [Roseivivax sediminis]